MPKSFEENNAVIKMFTDALGTYIASTATNESVFLSFLVLVMREMSDVPLTIWFQSQSTRARLETVRNICRAKEGDQSKVTLTLTAFILRFKGLTRQRNFYAHCIYDPQKDGTVQIRGFEIVEGDDVIKQVERKVTKGMCNEINRSVHQLFALNRDMWAFIDDYQQAFVRDGKIPEPLLSIPELFE